MTNFVDDIRAVSVGATATLIAKEAGNRQICTIYNTGSATVYIGTTDQVTTATGTPIVTGDKDHFLGGSAIYGIVATGTNDVRIHDVI